ncbi:DUF262 domain-containing protein [Sphingomonas sp. 1P06PA]|uniref:DUF262 domain-containing protein n=1 Tax=Sphingomonas sp. 1P06PA TaxID=554121 RepID=UPI0039A495C6
MTDLNTPDANSSQSALLSAIDAKIGEVRVDAIDFSFGELVNLKVENEIKIDPEYQRLFRWSPEQKSRLVESVLLKLPVPPIFFIENEDGRYELIDGLQRVSSMIQFIEPAAIDLDELELRGCDIIGDLNGMTFNKLPLTLRLQVKRSSVRAVIIKRQSRHFLRYEMFKRLNTGGSELSQQEIRNCSARLFGDFGIRFYEFLIKLSNKEEFFKVTETLADVEIEKRGREELVLRFFAAKDGQSYYHGHIADWLDDYMEFVLRSGEFDFDRQEEEFAKVFDAIGRVLGDNAFCKLKDGRPIGGLAPAHYEAIAIAFSKKLDKVTNLDSESLNASVVAARQSADFRSNVGAGANNRTKLRGRIAAIESAIDKL